LYVFVGLLPSLLAQETPRAAPGPKPLEEKTIYVPYDKLAEVFEKEGRGIFLPYKEFLELWQRAQPKPPPPPDVPPPAEAVIAGGLYKGQVEEGVARFEVEYRITALKKKGWSTLYLPLKNAAVEDARITAIEGEGQFTKAALSQAAPPEKAAAASPPLIASRGERYEVYLPEAGSYRVDLKLAVRVDSRPGRRSITFGIPPAAISRLDLLIPEAKAQVEVEPLMAATRIEEKESSTRLLAFVGSAENVTVSWSPPAGQIEKEAALLLAHQDIRAYLGERVLRVATDVEFSILRQEVERIRVVMPQDMEVFSVSSENLREWSVDRQSSPPVLELRLHSGVAKAHRFSLAFERILKETPRTLSVPLPRIEGVLRESGFVALGHDRGLNVRIAQLEGLSQLDLGELPESLRAGAFVGLRYLAQPLRLDLEIEKILPVIHAETVSAIIFDVEEDAWIGWIDYKVARSGVFTLQVELPARWRVQSLGDEGAVEDYQSAPRENDATLQVLTINLRNRASGGFRLPFHFAAPGSAAAGEKTVTALRALGVQGDKGLLGIGGPRSFRLVVGDRQNLVAADVQELYQSGLQARLPQAAVADLAFRYHEQPASVKVTLEARKTEIKVNTRLLVNVTNSAIQVQQDLEYLIQFAAVDSIAFSAPSSYDERLRYELQGARDLRKTPLADGRTRWEISLQSRSLGVRTIKVSYEERLDDLKTGEPKSVVLPLIRAEGDRELLRGEDGAVAIRKEGNLEVAETVEGLEVIDARELPPELAQGRIHKAYRFPQSQYRLELKLIRNEYIEVADAVVELILARVFATRELVFDTDALLVVENSSRQYLDLAFPKGSVNVRFYVNSQETTPQRIPGRPEEELRVPLKGTLGTTLVRVRYQSGAGRRMGSMDSFSIETPRVAGGEGAEAGRRVPVRKIELELYAPSENVYFPGSGTLHEAGTAHSAEIDWLALSLFSNAGVVRQARAAAAGYGQVQFPPPPPEFVREPSAVFFLETHAPEGNVNFRLIESRWFAVLNVAVFAAVLGLGIWATRRWRAERWWILGGAIAASLLFAWLSAPGKAILWLSAFRGSAVACLAVACLAWTPRLRHSYRRWREERLALEPDPYLEGAGKAVEPNAAAPSAAAADAPVAGLAPPAADEGAERDAQKGEDKDDGPADDASKKRGRKK
jgi:hypothetical protein